MSSLHRGRRGSAARLVPRASVAVAVGLVVGSGAAQERAAADHLAPPVDLVVDTYADTYDGNCGVGDCALRDAVATADPGDAIGMPSGLFALTRTGDGGVDAGDVDVERDLTIVGIGATGTFIDASSIDDRVFDVSGATVTLERLTIFGGRIEGRGAAIAIEDGSATLAGLTVIGGRSRNGGALAVTDATVLLRESTVLDTAATARGGGVSVHGTSSLDIVASTIADAHATRGGALWYGGTGELFVHRSTLARNQATIGGAIHAAAGMTHLRRTTIARNDATTGGAVVARVAIRVSGSALAANRSATGPPCVGSFVAGGSNVGSRGARSCGLRKPSDRVVRDVGLGPLASHGGPTPTISLDPSSPAIDTGIACGETDQRGARRDESCDAGAFELVRCLDVLVTVVGTRHDDELSGGRRADGILGRAGDDELQGSIGHDGVCGGAGSDRLSGGPGDDGLRGSHGDDLLRGEDGDDHLVGDSGIDVLVGGAGRDVCVVTRGDAETRSCEVVRRRSS